MHLVLLAVAIAGVSASGPLMAAIVAPALAISFWRNAAATALLAPWALARSRTEYRALGPEHLAAAVFAGVMLAGHFAAWVAALQLTSVAAATALVSSQIVWVVLIDRVRGVPSTPAVLMGCVLALVGVLVVSGVDVALSPEALIGDLLAVLGGLLAAFYLVAGERVRARLTTTGYTTLCYGTCALTLAVAALLSGVPLTGFDQRTWLLLAAVTVSAQLLGHSLLNHLLPVFSPMVISMALLLEVPGAALLAAVFLGQSPPWGVYVGLLLVLAGLTVVLVRRRPSPGEAPLGAD